ncbi:MAG: YkgJ family cysteine cluster protein [Lachnospiraceae bacterium]|nr:YkgJ family cysteine cluster protein [Lachnospiraceae bacterium]
MKRNVDLAEISDGKLYTENDMAKLGCNDCEGCSACCRGMGESIILDPLDIYRLTTGLGKSVEELLQGAIELHVVDGVILPNIAMQSDREACAFLNEAGRCSIHPYRPGICRLFPLGRYYADGDYKYILQVNECVKGNRTKVKVDKWIDTPKVKENHAYHVKWHYFLNHMEEILSSIEDENMVKQLNMVVLQMFYLSPYDGEMDFYEQFYARMSRMEAFLQEAGV